MRLALAALAAVTATGWHVIGRSPAVRGMVADVAARASARHPHALAVRVVGGGSITGSATVRCTRRGRARTIQASYVGRFAVLELPLAQPTGCTVAARATGTGEIVLEILAR
ncbi:MAG TPA: hypothetical protein VFA05_10265 [Gaiellaceae bacterium]|nr:hypothetical protein [Gaiellaceae bacterium]